MTKYLKGYKAVAILQIFVSLSFFTNPALHAYGTFFGVINSFGAGVLLTGSLLSYFSPKRWILLLMIAMMSCMIFFNAVWFIYYNVLFATGFPLIAYDVLFIVNTCDYVGRSL